MKIYTVLEAPDGNAQKVVLVPEGFAPWALLFTVFWAAWQRMWIVAALLLVLMAVPAVAVNLGWLTEGMSDVLQFGIAVIFGFEAHALQVRSLMGAGYRRMGLIQASGREAAEIAYFLERAPVLATSKPSRFSGASDNTLGLFGNV